MTNELGGYTREALLELCPKCRHPWWEHGGRFGCGANVDNLGASWAVEPGPCGCREPKPKAAKKG